MNNFMFVAISKSKYCLRGILKNRYQTQNIACVAFWKIKALLFNENNYGLAGRSLVVEIASGFIEPVLLTPFFSSLFFDFDFDRIDEFWSESTNFGQLFVFKSLMSNGCLNANNWPKFGEKFYPYHMIILSASILNFNIAAIVQLSGCWKLTNKRRLLVFLSCHSHIINAFYTYFSTGIRVPIEDPSFYGRFPYKYYRKVGKPKFSIVNRYESSEVAWSLCQPLNRFVTQKLPMAAIMPHLRSTACAGCLDIQHSRAGCPIADGMD